MLRRLDVAALVLLLSAAPSAGAAGASLEGGGDDSVYGGPGDDRLDGGPGADHHEGGAGANRCLALRRGDTANACEGGTHDRR